jgi:PKD domain
MKKIPCLCILLTSLLVSGSATACTGFMSSDNQQVLLGNNEDWLYPEAYLWFYPSQTNRYGRMYIKCIYPIPSNPEYLSCFAGINEHGLCYDVFLHPPLKPVNSSQKPTFQGDLMAYCLEKCVTVNEVLALFDQYNLEFMEDIQYLVVDATGDSVIIEGDTIISKQGTSQVVTNFLQSHPELGWYPCWRYDTAIRMLENMTEPSVESFRDICAATHQEGMYPTIYSYVFDITAGFIHLYHYYDYETVVTLNLTEELSLGVHSYSLPGFFEPEDNQPPRTPDRPSGPTNGKIHVPHEYTSRSSDPDTNVMYYLFDWGDGTTSNWVKQQDNGDGVASHTWDQRGTYEVKVKAKDIYGQESNWSDPLPITMPKNLWFEPPFPFLCRIIHRIRALLEQ